MPRSKEDYKYMLKLSRSRLKKGERRLIEVRKFLATYESQLEILRTQIEHINRRAEEFDGELPKAERYVKKQRDKINQVQKVLKLERELTELEREQRREKK